MYRKILAEMYRTRALGVGHAGVPRTIIYGGESRARTTKENIYLRFFFFFHFILMILIHDVRTEEDQRLRNYRVHRRRHRRLRSCRFAFRVIFIIIIIAFIYVLPIYYYISRRSSSFKTAFSFSSCSRRAVKSRIVYNCAHAAPARERNSQ